jgi:uncharacterized membrane protein
LETRSKLRIETLSDLVFGLALSIGSIGLINQPENGLEDVARGLFWFAFSFFILIGFWITYSKVMAAVRIETEWAFRLNVAMLFLVIIEPYLLNILAFDTVFQGSDQLMGVSTALYALDLAGIWLIMAGFYHLAIKQQNDSVVLRRERNIRLVDAAVFLLSALPFFWSVMVMDEHLRYIIWFLSVPLGWVAGRWIFPVGPSHTGEPA